MHAKHPRPADGVGRVAGAAAGRRAGGGFHHLIPMKKTRVLVAEDEAAVRAFMDEALHFLGFEVTVAVDGEEALARVAQGGFDVVITDHRMPGLNGMGLVRALRAAGFAGRVFVVSGALAAAERADYAALGVDGIAAKPLALAELNGLLRGRRPAGAAA